jgi:hypothetical protein
MKLKKIIRNYFRWHKFKNKIEKSLPGYSPYTGVPIDWEIYITYLHLKYDKKTGLKIGGYPVLRIVQKPPFRIIADPNIYKFNWKKKELTKSRFLRWVGMA